MQTEFDDVTVLRQGRDGTAGDAADDERAPDAESAALALRRDADRAVRHAALGGWRAVVVECAEGVIALAPVERDGDAVAVLRAGAQVYPEHARRAIERAAARANDEDES